MLSIAQSAMMCSANRRPIANGMFPRPPQLFKAKGVTNDPAGKTYWKIANGIRLMEMPPFQQSPVGDGDVADCGFARQCRQNPGVGYNRIDTITRELTSAGTHS